MTRRVHIVSGAFVHTFYREQLKSCPAPFEYDVEPPKTELHELKSDLAAKTPSRFRAEEAARSFFRGVRGMTQLPNFRVSFTRADLVHSWQYPLLSNRPWVVDFEDAASMLAYRPVSDAKPHARRVLGWLLRQNQCRALLPWTEMAKQSLLAEVGDDLDSKCRVVLPAISPKPFRRETEGGPSQRLLFIGSTFMLKGGLTLLRAFARVRSSFPDATLSVVSFVPSVYKAEADRIGGVEIHERLAPEALDHLFRTSRALVAPFTADTLGYVVLEAFSYGLPAIVTRHFSLPELVTHESTGLVVSTSISLFDERGRRLYPPATDVPRDAISGHPLIDLLNKPVAADVDALAEGMARMLSDDDATIQMGLNAWRETTDGRFSHGARRAVLSDVYAAALQGTGCA